MGKKSLLFAIILISIFLFLEVSSVLAACSPGCFCRRKALGQCPSHNYCDYTCCGASCDQNVSFCCDPAAAICNPNGCNGNCPAGCSVAEDPDCGCQNGNGCCGTGCSNANDNDCAVGCNPDGCNGACGAACTVAEDPDCGCQNGDGCCGMGCTNVNDNDCGGGATCAAGDGCLAGCNPSDPDCGGGGGACLRNADDCSKDPIKGYCFNPCHLDSVSGLYVGLNNPNGRVCMCNPLTSDTLEDLLASLISFIFMVATAIFPIMVAIAAFLFMTAAGNPSNIEKAKNILIYSSIGYGIVVLANVLVYVIKGVIGAI